MDADLVMKAVQRPVHIVEYKRRGDWWASGGLWYQISTWCNEQIGVHEWDYVNECFIFIDEQDKIMFKLRWS